MCIERGKPWQAEWLISGARDHVLALACLRLGLATRYAKGADELRRALRAAADAYAAELDRTDQALAAQVRPMLGELLG